MHVRITSPESFDISGGNLIGLDAKAVVAKEDTVSETVVGRSMLVSFFFVGVGVGGGSRRDGME